MVEKKLARVVVVGQGYVGLPLSLAAVGAGNLVTGIDLDRRKVDLLAAGVSCVEDVANNEVGTALANGSYTVSSDYANADGFDVAVITVPTPLREGEPDLSYIQSAGKSLSKYVAIGSTVILESTTYPGTTEELLLPILERGSGLKAGVDFYLGYSPERIDPGNPLWNLVNTPKVVSGIDEDSLVRVSGFYENLGISTVKVSGTREAEMSKLLENTFRHVNIALVNELAKFSRHLGVDIWEAIEAAATKPFGFMKFTPGPGVGGHCLPIDPTYLSWAVKSKVGSDFRFVALANSVNSSMPALVVERVSELLKQNGKEVEGARIVILGIAYKPNTGDTRESPALALATLLSSVGANVFGVDSLVPDELWPRQIAKANPTEGQLFDVTILVTRHATEADDWVFGQSETILDTLNILRRESVEQLW